MSVQQSELESVLSVLMSNIMSTRYEWKCHLMVCMCFRVRKTLTRKF